ncbi:hypothetical protein ACFX2F_041393 [Malus domestica]
MAWFRAVSSVAKLAIRRNLSNCGSYMARSRVLPSQNRDFHTTLCKAQSAPIPRPVPLSRLNDSFLDGTSSVYLEGLQRDWEADPNSVDESWDNFFRNFVGQASTSPGVSGQTIQESMRLLLLVRAYQVSGHMKAQLDPLGLEERDIPDDLDPALYGFTEADLDREFFLGVWRMSGFLAENRPVQTLRSILTRLEQAYCGTIGYEYMHIADRNRCNWLRDKIETPTPMQYNRQRREVILDRLMWSTQFENFLATKWKAAKRFGLEGGETLIPGMKEMFDRAADLGVEGIVIGMPHRGRLNVLGNVVRKPLRQIFNEFSGGTKPVDEDGLYTGTGDVKYHLGTSYDRPTRGGKRLHLSLVANPSHLEAVDPVVVGKTRAKQFYSNDVDRTKNMGVLIHGDGSFAGQGVVYETLHLSALPNYTTGGTIHIVVNNQVAFTTDPMSGRSSEYCTDVAKALNAPIFHVNADDMEAVAHVCELAAEWRQTFHSDVVVDLVCYRRFGHNEMDEPSFTQPEMYKVIRNHPPALTIYQNKLLESAQVTKEDIERIQNKVNSILNEELLASKDYVPQKRDWLASHWSGFKSPEQISRIQNTGVKPEILKSVGKSVTALPETFKAHKGVKKVYEQRAQMIETGEGIDWAVAEALAFATLIVEGNHVRLSGQDVERGTFSHRHSVVHDQETGEKYCPLDNIMADQDEELFTVSNSSLSEFGVLGFELGYSMESPNSLVIWEAQFGDFSNGAQVIFDQFLSGGESKWLRQTGLVVLLPHGYMGQGPEHSSARLERFLQMSDDNPFVIPEMDSTHRKQIQECNWQIHREFRKPLIVMAPKNLLRHKDCKSNLSEFDDVQGHPGFDKQGTRFKRLIKDQNHHSDLEEGIRRLVLCSGKLYYELDGERIKVGAKDVAICRVEQLCPFPYDLIQRELKRYPNAEIVWCQEEPMNMGAYSYIAPRLSAAMKSLGRGTIDDVKYIGRDPSAATATGFSQVHDMEQNEILQKAMQSILTRLEQAYCGTIGYEYMHIADRERCNWLRDKIETPTPMQYNRQRREWTTAKRFGLEGGETLIPGMKVMFDRAADLGVESIVIGMPHRGRLNVLGNVVRKPLRQIFSEFSGGTKPVDEVGLYTGTGDVKYHLGTSYDRPSRGGKRIHLFGCKSKSLEAVDPVVVGKTRAKQYYSNDVDRTKNMGILIHGDGSFAGQGVVYETLHLSALPNYTTGGTIQIVVNNQVAFTTDPMSGRSSQYCTDVAKALNAPIFHVNGDDMEAVVHVCELAAEWWQTFHSDVVVDLVCYRRFGHNEIDEPSFTQPKMYKVIRNHPSALTIYQNKLLESGQVTKEDIEGIQNRISRIRNTGVKPEILKSVGKAVAALPNTFKPPRAVKKVYEQRGQMIETGEGIDWAVAEALAFATLLVEGNHVRLSGQDVERVTFSHRHSVLHDQETGEKYCPFDHITAGQDEEMFKVNRYQFSCLRNVLVIWNA